MKNWLDLGSDVNWQDHGGKWGKKAKDGSWYVIKFIDFHDATGETDGDKYNASLVRVDLSDLPVDTIASAKSFAGLDSCDRVVEECEIVAACADYGSAQPLSEFWGNRATSVRADARRAAENYQRSAIALENQLDRQVNAIGNDAREYARGEFWGKAK